MIKRSRYTLLYSYVAREYVFSFFVSFLFFFFIFFVNQILVFAQKIILKDVNITEMLSLVSLYIPQFLMYTMPFSSFASASMVIGNFSAYNEILAFRSNGISSKHVFLPIVFISLIFSYSTFLIADYLIPVTARRYREVYGKILEKIPTVELSSYSSTRFGNRVISNGVVEGNVLNNVLVFDDTDERDSKVVWAEKAEINLIDLEMLIYCIDLYNPKILITDSMSETSYSVSKADKITMYLKLSATGSGYSPITPSQMSLKELSEQIKNLKIENDELLKQLQRSQNALLSKLLDSYKNLESLSDVTISDIQNYVRNTERYQQILKTRHFSFYYQFYRSEYQKKLALSAACTILVIIAFPLSFVRLKHGRLTGLGLSIIVASLYWFALYFLHTKAISSAENPLLFIWLPNFIVFLTGFILLWRHSRQ